MSFIFFAKHFLDLCEKRFECILLSGLDEFRIIDNIIFDIDTKK